MNTSIRTLEPADAPALTALYHTYEWWDDREETRVEKALGETDLPLGLFVDGDLVGAARVLTDYTYYARIWDVILHEEYRGERLGEELLTAILDHPDLADVDTVTLSCREGLVEFYERCGFDEHDGLYEHGGEEEPARMMYVADR